MKKFLISSMPGERAPAQRLADALQADMQEIAVHHFPDGESRVRAPAAGETSVIYCSLDRPNAKLVELILAASALRDLGAKRLILVAPYLCYMRQDIAFEPGEAVSQKVIGQMLAPWFDRIVTIEPHLHRTRSLSDVFAGIQTTSLSATPLVARLIEDLGMPAFIVGPDSESRSWAQSVADSVGAPLTILKKTRHGDRSVTVALDEGASVAGGRAIIVDDVASTGETLAAAARILKSAGAAEVDAIVVHALFDDRAARTLHDSGVVRIQSTDSVRHPSNAIEVAPLLAHAIREECCL